LQKDNCRRLGKIQKTKPPTNIFTMSILLPLGRDRNKASKVKRERERERGYKMTYTTKPRENCIVCGKKIHRSKVKATYKTRRSVNSVTCSHECARLYEKIARYVREKRNSNLNIKKEQKAGDRSKTKNANKNRKTMEAL